MTQHSPNVRTASSLKEWAEESGHASAISAALAEGSVVMVGHFAGVPAQEEVQAAAPQASPSGPKAPRR